MKNLFLLLFCLIISSMISQKVVLRYAGNQDEKMHFSYNYFEFNKDFEILSRQNRNLEFSVSNDLVISSNDYIRKTLIFAQINDTIDFTLDKNGLINYWSKSNIYRKNESEFINLCFKKYGQIDLFSTKKLFSKFYLASGLSVYNDKDYLQEIKCLNQFLKDDKISEPFYKYFRSIYWSLALSNNLEIDNFDKIVIHKIEESYNDASYLLNIFEYRKLLTLYSSILQLNAKAISLKEKLELIAKEFSNFQVKDYLLYNEVRNYLDTSRNNVLTTEQYNKFRENCTNPLFLEDIKTDYISFQNDLMFSDIISKYKGKLILVDFWASWCMPCREEFAYEVPLIQKFPDVHFVFVSTDIRKSAWLHTMVKYPKLLKKENNYLLKKSNTDKLLKKINLTTIPRYVLFGKNGEILNINAPRPSTKELENLILENL